MYYSLSKFHADSGNALGDVEGFGYGSLTVS